VAGLISPKNFWRYWLGGILLFAVMVALNPSITVAGVPQGIGDHQAAATAVRVNEIHSAWQSAGVLDIAKFGMAIDLLFIGIYAFGAFIGGMLFRAMPSAAMRRLGSVIVVAAVIFCIADYAETISQFVQIMQAQGSDNLAGIAAFVQPIKMIAFLTTFVGILAGLLLQRRLNPPSK